MRNHWLRNLIPALALAALPMLPTASFAGVMVGVSINIAPPVLPVYVQPPLPEPGYIWTPGYWAYGDDGYFWVPGTWVLPPTAGFLWTPGYWGWGGGVYMWHAGYWGPHVGFYGGVNYGFGYGGVGFEGGYWRGGSYFYNRSVVNVGTVHVTNVYNKTIVNVNNHVSFNGGAGGIQARPTPGELAAEHEHHIEATSVQRNQREMAAGNRELRASVNHGRPAVAATQRPGQFSGRGVVSAHGSGPHGGPVHDIAHNAGPGAHGGSPLRTDRPPGAGHAENFSGGAPAHIANTPRPAGGNPGGNPGGGHPGGFGGGAPHFANTPRPAGGNPGGGHPGGGGGHPQPQQGHRPEGHRR